MDSELVDTLQPVLFILEPSLYDDFARVLRTDVLKNQKDKIVLERTYGIARRLGFPQIPLACVCIRYLNLMLATPFCSSYLHMISSYQVYFIFALIFSSLFIIKLTVGVGLILYAGYVSDLEQKEDKLEEMKPTKGYDASGGSVVSLTEDSATDNKTSITTRPSVLKLSDIERYSVLQKRA